MVRLARAALPLLAAVAVTSGPASASVTVPGCYGVGPWVYCNITVRSGVPFSATPYRTTVPVCVSTCVNVPVTLVDVDGGGPTFVCITVTERGGGPETRCTAAGPVMREVEGAVDDVKKLDPEAVLDRVVAIVCRKVQNPCR